MQIYNENTQVQFQNTIIDPIQNLAAAIPKESSLFLQDLDQTNFVDDVMQKVGLKPTYDEKYSGEEYLKSGATDKQDKLWQQVIAAKGSSGSFPNPAGIFLEGMDASFHTPGDVMPKEGLFHTTRTKYIHSVGAHGKVKFVPSAEKHPYTGIFEGAENGIIRLSSAAKPTADGKQPLAPGMGLKFLRDGVDSANLVSMWSTSGQPGDWNFFSNDFFTHIGSATGALVVLGKKFATETEFIQEVGLSDMAAYGQDGKKADKEVFPFSLRFSPHSDVHTLFPKELQDGDAMKYVSQLETLAANVNLYTVYAMDQPKEMGGKETLIGTLQLDGQMTKSKWGDEILFFRHQLMNDDLKIKGDWAKYTPKCPFFGK